MIASALLHNFSKCTGIQLLNKGIELQAPVHEVALKLRSKYEEIVKYEVYNIFSGVEKRNHFYLW